MQRPGIICSEKIKSAVKKYCIAAFLLANLFAASSWANDRNGIGKNNYLSWEANANIQKHPVSGKIRFIGIKKRKPLQREKNKQVSQSIIETYAPAFGLNNPLKQLKLKKQTLHSDSVTTFRYQQLYNNLPVIAAELVAGMDTLEQVNYISGETVTDLSLNTKAAISAVQATDIALRAVSKWYRHDDKTLVNSQAELSIFKASILSPDSKPAMLVWKITVSSDNVNELLLIDANSGAITFHLNQLHSVLNRRTYSANNTASYQAELICDETDTNCDAGDSDAKLAHQYAADTYNFYFDKHGRDGIDGIGGAIISSVHVGPDFQNAAWTGSQIIYGDGFPQADDVVAHELTHGVTDKESNLFYYYQAGAINESFSDLWGEFVDQTNSGGTDNASAKWKIGEDIPTIGDIRNMKNPGLFLDPDKMSSSNYFTGSEDNGGVHINSGINNKAVYLMTDGGTFNGQTISGLGITKVAQLYYEVQTKHLTSGSDYLDLYNALIQACSDLVTLSSADCTQVENALLAVEMNQQPVKGFNPEASLCPTNTSVGSTLFSDDLESGLSNWVLTHNTSLLSNDWLDWLTKFPGIPYATSGLHSLYGENVSTVSDKYAQISITLPNTTDKIFLHFKHAIDLEAVATNSQNEYYDAAVLEYSTDNGTSWNDAVDLIVDGKTYTGIIDRNNANPLAGRLAFSSTSHGFVSTRVNLTSFSNSTLLLRWRIATDSSIAATGWLLDDINVVTCTTATGQLPTANAGSDQFVNPGDSVSLNASASSDADGALTYSWEQVSGKVVSLSDVNSATPAFTMDGNGGVVAFKLTVTDTDELTDTDIVNVIVNTAPTARAGNDFEAVEATTATLNGSLSSDTDGSVVGYRWTQTGGDAVTLNNADTATASFTVPAFPAATLRFSLVVTDNDGNDSLADTVNVTVKSAAIVINNSSGGGCSLNTKADFNPFMLLLLLGLSLLHISIGYRKRNRP